MLRVVRPRGGPPGQADAVGEGVGGEFRDVLGHDVVAPVQVGARLAASISASVPRGEAGCSIAARRSGAAASVRVAATSRTSSPSARARRRWRARRSRAGAHVVEAELGRHRLGVVGQFASTRGLGMRSLGGLVGHLDHTTWSRKAVELRLRSGKVPRVLDRVLGRHHHEGIGQPMGVARHRDLALGHASSSADCTLGGARLTSSTRISAWNRGPARNSKVPRPGARPWCR